MPGQPQGAKITTDHDIIKRWVAEREGKPAIVQGMEPSELEALRVKFASEKNYEKLVPLKWEDFFRTFEEECSAFLYQDETVDGEVSHFYKFVNR